METERTDQAQTRLLPSGAPSLGRPSELQVGEAQRLARLSGAIPGSRPRDEHLPHPDGSSSPHWAPALATCALPPQGSELLRDPSLGAQVQVHLVKLLILAEPEVGTSLGSCPMPSQRQGQRPSAPSSSPAVLVGSVALGAVSRQAGL